MSVKIPALSLMCFVLAVFLCPRVSLGQANPVGGCLDSGGAVDPLINSTGFQNIALDLGIATTISVAGTVASDGFLKITKAPQAPSSGVYNCSVSAGQLVIANGERSSGTVDVDARVGTSDEMALFLKGPFNRLVIGQNGDGTMRVIGGGFVDAASDPQNCPSSICNNFVSNFAGSTGILIIDGLGSRVDAVNAFVVGAAAVFDVENQGGSSTGVVEILNGGVLNTQRGTIGQGAAGTIPTGTEFAFGMVTLDGPGSRWNVTENIRVGGPAIPGTGEGILKVCAGSTVTTGGSIVFLEGGTAAGNGGLTGNVTFNNGKLTPGCSTGTLTVDGDVNFESGEIVIEVEDLAAGRFDVLDVSGNVDFLGGTIRFEFSNGFAPQAGDMVPFIQAASVSGLDNLGVEIVGLLPGFDFEIGDSGELIALNDAAPDMVAPLLDLRPGDDADEVDVDSNQVFPVAILTTGNQPIFDALQIDPDTIQFGPLGAQPVRKKIKLKDVDHDGDMDLRVWFRVRQTGLACGDTEAGLTASTFAGTAVEATASLNAVCED